MRIIGIFGRSRGAWTVSYLAVAFVAASPLTAQVTEIGDDGDVRIYSGPARFVVDGSAFSPVAIEIRGPRDPDRYERAARAEGVDPGLLRAIAWTESRGRMSAISAKGAIGIMQLMPGTAAALGVDPLDPDANIVGGARYLSRMMARFQSVPVALAAYNAGPGAVRRWGGVPPFAETRSYVTSVLSRWRTGSAMPAVVADRATRAASFVIEVP